jgi:hypothetical protein
MLSGLRTGDLERGFTSWFDMTEVGTALSLGMLLGNVLACLVPDRRLTPVADARVTSPLLHPLVRPREASYPGRAGPSPA